MKHGGGGGGGGGGGQTGGGGGGGGGGGVTSMLHSGSVVDTHPSSGLTITGGFGGVVQIGGLTIGLQPHALAQIFVLLCAIRQPPGPPPLLPV